MKRVEISLHWRTLYETGITMKNTNVGTNRSTSGVFVQSDDNDSISIKYDDIIDYLEQDEELILQKTEYYQHINKGQVYEIEETKTMSIIDIKPILDLLEFQRDKYGLFKTQMMITDTKNIYTWVFDISVDIKERFSQFNMNTKDEAVLSKFQVFK